MNIDLTDRSLRRSKCKIESGPVSGIEEKAMSANGSPAEAPYFTQLK